MGPGKFVSEWTVAEDLGVKICETKPHGVRYPNISDMEGWGGTARFLVRLAIKLTCEIDIVRVELQAVPVTLPELRGRKEYMAAPGIYPAVRVFWTEGYWHPIQKWNKDGMPVRPFLYTSELEGVTQVDAVEVRKAIRGIMSEPEGSVNVTVEAWWKLEAEGTEGAGESMKDQDEGETGVQEWRWPVLETSVGSGEDVGE